MRSSERISRRPIVGFSEAPTTAIDFGRNSASSRMPTSLRLFGRGTRSHAGTAAATGRGWPAEQLKKYAGDELCLEFVGVRPQPVETALAAIAVHLKQFGAEPQPRERRPAAGQGEGAAMLVRPGPAAR